MSEIKNGEKRRKKTEHTNIVRSSLKLVRQNIHVMLSYAIITKRTKPKKNKFMRLVNNNLVIIGLVSVDSNTS